MQLILSYFLRHRGEPLQLIPPGAAQPSSSSLFSGGLAAANIVPPPRRRASPSNKTKEGFAPCAWPHAATPIFTNFLKQQYRTPCIKPSNKSRVAMLRSQTRPSTAQRGRGSHQP